MSFYSISDFIRENYPEYWGIQSYPIAECVRIHKIDEEWGIFSNFGHTPLVIEGVTFDTSERLFQLMKFKDEQIVVFYGSNSWACDCDGLTLLGENEALRVTGTEGLSKRDLWYPLCRRGERDTWIEGDPGYRSSI